MKSEVVKERVHRIRQILLKRLPDSRLTPMSEPPKHPGLPEHLVCLFSELGTGTIGRGRYAIHDLMSPAEVYDEKTAASLEGILIVGDDFSGNCEAYDTSQGWTFGQRGVQSAHSVCNNARFSRGLVLLRLDLGRLLHSRPAQKDSASSEAVITNGPESRNGVRHNRLAHSVGREATTDDVFQVAQSRQLAEFLYEV